jgi:enterochelin esterase family protein
MPAGPDQADGAIEDGAFQDGPLAAGSFAAGARADEGAMTFGVADPGRALAGVRLRQEAGIPAEQLDFSRCDDGWQLRLPRPPLARLEYLLELRYPGGAKVVTDPANARQAAGAFGPKSVLEFPGYARPAWLAAGCDQGERAAFDLPGPDGVIGVRTWAPSGTPRDLPLPLLVVHDGPEYDALASLTRYLGAGVRGGWLPRLRAALLSPGQRNSWYSASPRYARVLARQVLPALLSAMPCTVAIGMGTSLGALAMLHAHVRHPGTFGALFLQSGSFFTASTDSQERRFAHYRRIVAFTAQLHDAAAGPGAPVPAVLTCGATEENAACNRLMTATLAARGYPARLHEVPDLHNYTAWRDAFDPALSALLRSAGG